MMPLAAAGAEKITPVAVKTAEAVVQTASGQSIERGMWTLVVVVVTTVGAIWLAYIKQWGPWKQADSEARAADFERLRAEIASLKEDHRKALEAQNKRIEKLEAEVDNARRDATLASAHAMRSDTKLQTALTACELLLGVVERELPEAKELPLVKRLLAQAAADDLGIGDGMRKLATFRGVGE